MFFIARSLELRALPYAINLSPRAAASFNYGAGGIQIVIDLVFGDEGAICSIPDGEPAGTGVIDPGGANVSTT